MPTRPPSAGENSNSREVRELCQPSTSGRQSTAAVAPQEGAVVVRDRDLRGLSPGATATCPSTYRTTLLAAHRSCGPEATTMTATNPRHPTTTMTCLLKRGTQDLPVCSRPRRPATCARRRG